MTVENLQSTQIAALDGYPFTGVSGAGTVYAGTGRLSVGADAASKTFQIMSSITPTTGKTAGSYYQFARVPTNCIIRAVEFLLVNGSTSTLTGDVTVAFSDSTIDGTQPSNQVVPSGLTTAANAYIANPAATTTGLTGTASVFAHAEAFGGFTNGVWTDVTWLQAGTTNAYTYTSIDTALWKVIGYTSDPGGYFDIVVYTTATNSVSSVELVCRVSYTLPAPA